MLAVSVLQGVMAVREKGENFFLALPPLPKLIVGLVRAAEGAIMDVERKLDMSLDELIKENPREKAARGTDRGGRGRKGSPEGSSGKGKPSAAKAQTTDAAPTVRLCCLVIGRFLPDRCPGCVLP